MNCPAGHVHEAGKRATNFKTVLRAFGFPFNGTRPTTSTPVTTGGSSTTQQGETTAAPETTSAPQPSGGECNSSCSTCVFNPSNPNNQTATDDNCAACAAGQSWWPCNIESLCVCAGGEETTAAPTTVAP